MNIDTMTSAELVLELATRLSVPCAGDVCTYNRDAVAKGLPVIDALDDCEGMGRLWPLREPCWHRCIRNERVVEVEVSDCLVCAGRGWVPKTMHLEDLFWCVSRIPDWPGHVSTQGVADSPAAILEDAKRVLLKALRTVAP